MKFEYGAVSQVSPLIRRVVAENPGAFTLYGTGTYIVGSRKVAVIDPGPVMPSHLEALEAALNESTVTHIFVTHTHRDHSPAARPLQSRFGGVICAHGPHGSGRIDPGLEVEEGADWTFEPDANVVEGDVIEGAGWSIEGIHTPGHTSNHMCYHLRQENALFTGDHVMGWSTTIVSPPDGEMWRYVDSLKRLRKLEHKIYWPTHGPPIPEPARFVESLIAHREIRTDQIIACLDIGIDWIVDIVRAIYVDLPDGLQRAAARSVFATLIDLVDTGRVRCLGRLTDDSRFHLSQRLK